MANNKAKHLEEIQTHHGIFRKRLKCKNLLREKNRR